MRLVGKLLRVLLVLVVVAVAALTGIVGAVTLRSLPQQDGAIQVAGLESSATVLRDEHGIVNIYADTPHDLFLAQGYVHAQERLWQMEVWRHISAGRLSELFGKSTLDQDRFIRTLGWRQAAERDFAALSEAPRAALDAYAQGVNAFIEEHQGSLGMAFVVTGTRNGTGGIGGYELEPWTALDSLAWQKVQAWQLGGNFDSEVFRMLADEHLGDPALTDQLFPAYWDTMPVITPSSAAAGPSPAPAAAATTPGAGPSGAATAAWRDVAALGGRIMELAGLDGGGGLAGDHQVGSNNWVLGPSMSESGGALLANDPHLGISMPSVWFINGLHCRTVDDACPIDATGVTFPGVPGIVLGHNGRIAWGATNADPDVQDLFVETVDPDNADNYLFAGESTPFAVRSETITVAGGEDVVIEVRETRHGPVLNDVDERLADAPLLALRWTATADVDGTFEAIFALQTASTFEEFRQAFTAYGSPSQNFVYADVDGHIGYVLPGRIPIRSDGADRGARPRSGSDGAHEWSGYIPFEQLPAQLDPAAGYVVTANNAAVDPGYPYFIASEWDPGYRAARIVELLEESDGRLSVEEMAAIQNDTRIGRADRVMSHLDGIAAATPDGNAVLEQIRLWDGLATPDSIGAAAYCAFENNLLRGLFDDELGDLAREYVGGGASWQAMIGFLDDPRSAWWDDIATTGRKESAPDVLVAALDAAGAELRGAYGEPKDWTWGRVHRATFREQTLGTSGIGPLEWYFNKGPVAVGGAAGAVTNTYYRPDRAYANPYDPDFEPVGIEGLFDVTNLPSYRLLIDMAATDGARIVQTTGQSGNPFDSHYGDLIDEWATGVTVPLFFSEPAVEATVAKRLTLVP
ncbi:MAG TPA: penicillin acylase family protein [Candidatus Limnocylindrales bacterium]|nr:penicillin acylase family protein [Candidatus Limnocylindrales bacterium]